MMPIKFIKAELSPDQQIKQREATKQMQELLGVLSKGVRYATLTVADRTMLLQKGYAKDLVDNLVFFTQRASEDIRSKEKDQLVIGFTHAAFDPSIYACDSIVKSLVESHQGRCAYCESRIDHVNSRYVSHFRPAWGALEGASLDRQAYYGLAYDQHNLLYSCEVCSEAYKGSQFPVRGSRAPAVSTSLEQPLLINPYDEDPRKHIRFNPLNGEAYAYDAVLEYYATRKGIKVDDIEFELWSDPFKIPRRIDRSENSELRLNRDYIEWSNSHASISKGMTSIDVLGLNRSELVRARVDHLRKLYGIFTAQHQADNQDSEVMRAYLDSLINGESTNDSYRSLSIDAINSWKACADSQISWFKNYGHVVDSNRSSTTLNIPPKLSSSLHYMVLETELELAGKRRIVCLHSSDFLYGSDRKAKTVFLPIDWERDFENVIKVSSDSLLWEASFSELSETQPVALQSLFANNELWAEGDYPSLV